MTEKKNKTIPSPIDLIIESLNLKKSYEDLPEQDKNLFIYKNLDLSSYIPIYNLKLQPVYSHKEYSKSIKMFI